MRGGVFICYRGTDSHSYGALLWLELSRHFGADSVFLDSMSIPAGADYVDRLLGQVRRSGVLLAVIGPSWLSATDAAGCRLIDDPKDWVRRELVEAFAAGVLVVPVLTDDAEMPTEEQLPVEIAALSRCQYRRLRHRDVADDVNRIRLDLETTFAAVPAARVPGWLDDQPLTSGAALTSGAGTAYVPDRRWLEAATVALAAARRKALLPSDRVTWAATLVVVAVPLAAVAAAVRGAERRAEGLSGGSAALVLDQ